MNLPLWTSLEIDIHSACNRDCAFCPRHLDRSGVRKDAEGHPVHRQMPTEQVYRLLDQARALGYRGKVKLHRLSEGLLDPRYLELAHSVKDKGMRLQDDTNGDVLRRDKELCARLDGVVDQFTIGLYDYRTDQEKLREMAFWRNRFRKTVVAFSLPRERYILRQGSAFYETLPKKARTLELPCTQPLHFFHIRYDGQVSLCCEDDGCRFGLGDAFTEDLEAIWWSSRHVRIARILEKPGGRRRFPRCRRCFFAQKRFDLLGLSAERSFDGKTVSPPPAG